MSRTSQVAWQFAQPLKRVWPGIPNAVLLFPGSVLARPRLGRGHTGFELLDGRRMAGDLSSRVPGSGLECSARSCRCSRTSACHGCNNGLSPPAAVVAIYRRRDAGEAAQREQSDSLVHRPRERAPAEVKRHGRASCGNRTEHPAIRLRSRQSPRETPADGSPTR